MEIKKLPTDPKKNKEDQKKEHPELSGKEGSMSNILRKNLYEINDSKSISELIQKVTELFKTNNLNTTASRRLLANLQKSKNLESGFRTLYNSILAGDNLETIK